jgi:hypothetical protein
MRPSTTCYCLRRPRYRRLALSPLTACVSIMHPVVMRYILCLYATLFVIVLPVSRYSNRSQNRTSPRARERLKVNELIVPTRNMSPGVEEVDETAV